jgi:uncharacterized protein
MTVSMYKISVPIFVQFLTSLPAVLDKAAAHCEAKKIEPSALLNARLFSRHISVRSPGARRNRSRRHATGRLSGAEPPALGNAEASFAELKQRLDKAIEFVKNFKPTQIDGSEEKTSR